MITGKSTSPDSFYRVEGEVFPSVDAPQAPATYYRVRSLAHDTRESITVLTKGDP